MAQINRNYIIAGILGLSILLSLWPIGRLIQDWIEYSRILAPVTMDSSDYTSAYRGFHWVHWEEDEDGHIKAVYVFPRTLAYENAIEENDEFYALDHVQIFSAEALKTAIEGIPPGESKTFSVLREGEVGIRQVDVRFSNYPTFLYPLSDWLWQASIWGFLIGAFIHVLAIIIVVPLSFRSKPAFSSMLLIVSSSVWVFGNLIRILFVTFVGPADMASPGYAQLFEVLTLISLSGWIGFPVLLLEKVLSDHRILNPRIRLLRWLIYVPPVVLFTASLIAVYKIELISPITLDALINPILFYVCGYVATATGLSSYFSFRPLSNADQDLTSTWNRAGSVVVFFLATLSALSVFGIVPIRQIIIDQTAGGLIVGVQLLSVAPVLLVSFATLKYGKIDQVLRRALTYLFSLGLIFFIFVGGMAFLSTFAAELLIPSSVISGLYLVLILFLFDRFAQRLRRYTAPFLMTDLQRARQELQRFGQVMRTYVDPHRLVQETTERVGDLLSARSTVLYLESDLPNVDWIEGNYHIENEPDVLSVVKSGWPQFKKTGLIWSHNPELSEYQVSAPLSLQLFRAGVALVVPILQSGQPIGVLAVGRKRKRRSVYNLEEVDMLRSLAVQLALVMERLSLIEREKALIRRTAESRLTALRAQINPHFLFNTLNTISALTEEKSTEAVRTVEDLAAIFRHILNTESKPFVPLQDELSLVRHYLSIEQVRFEDRLRIEEYIDASLGDIPVPAFVLQTLVENAVKHGLAKKREGGVLRLTCRPFDSDLIELIVHDTGVGIPTLFGRDEVSANGQEFLGIGLRNVTERLEQLYERTDLLHFSSDPVDGTTVRLMIPVQHSASIRELALFSTETH